MEHTHTHTHAQWSRKWMNGGRGRMSTIKKEGRTTEDKQIEKSQRQGQEEIPSQHMKRDHRISRNRALWLNVQEDKKTRVERQPWDSQYWYRRLSREYGSTSDTSTIELTDQKT